MKLKTLSILALFLFSASASAFPASIDVVDREATIEDPAEFHVTVENEEFRNQTFKISSILSTEGDFVYDRPKKVGPNQEEVFNITVRPEDDDIQQNYRFTVNVRSESELEKLENYFRVTSKYDLNIESTAIESSVYDPGDEVSGNITLKNTAAGTRDYTVKAKMLGQSSTKTGKVISGQQTTLNFRFPVPGDTSPGQKDFEIMISGKSNQTVSHSFNVTEIRKIVSESSKENRIAEVQKTSTYTNEGNAPVTIEVNETVPSYAAPLTTFNQEPDRSATVNGENTFYWTLELEPGETSEIRYSTMYWPPVALLAALVVLGLLLKRFHTGFTVVKTAEKTEDGIKVQLEIENNSGHVTDNVEVKDFVPDIAAVDEDFKIAKPVIRKTSGGTRLTWELDEMQPGEQRVLEYRIRPVIEVEGGAVLSEAELELEGRKVAESGEVEVEFRPD